MKIITNKVDNLHPETRAMLQAFYSRSYMGIEERLQDLGESEEKIKAALKKYYVGYGHASVGELASITIFFEDVSMLAAKAIQDNPLYNGQESSTRYIDYSNQKFISPYGEDDTFFNFWGERFREFYIRALPKTIEYIKSKYPDTGDRSYDKTVKAKAFDVVRGFLPAGFATNVAWTGSLRNIGEHLRKLINHPLNEVKDIAYQTYKQLLQEFPNSFRELRGSDINPEIEKFFYLRQEGSSSEFSSEFTTVTTSEYNKHNTLYKCVRLNSDHLLDFASWRDLQRHRNMVSFMPLLTTKLGFSNFYIDNLPEDMREEARSLIAEIDLSLSLFEGLKDENKQYVIPMGFLCNIMIDMDLHQAVYLAELRSSKTVHPTLRVWAQELGKFLKNKFDISAKVDYDEESWTLKRGTQDIIKND